MKSTRRRRIRGAGRPGGSSWSVGLGVQAGGAGVLAHAGSVLPRLLADRVGLSGGLSRVVTRAGFTPVHERGRVLVDAAAALCAGAVCVTDIEALSRQNALLGGRGVSDSTVVRASWMSSPPGSERAAGPQAGRGDRLGAGRGMASDRRSA